VLAFSFITDSVFTVKVHKPSETAKQSVLMTLAYSEVGSRNAKPIFELLPVSHLLNKNNLVMSHGIKIDNRSFETVEQFKYLGTDLTDKNSIQEEIKSRMKSGKACHHSVQNLLSSS
jgi:hypothetical protein